LKTDNDSQELIFETKTPEETLGLAREFATRLNPGDVVALIGDLGVGKTIFAKGIVAISTGLAEEEITSPTFTLVEEYPGKPPIFHVDLYRLEKPSELDELPWDDLLAGEAITLIEWPEKFQNLLSYCNYQINISKKGEGERVIRIHSEDT